MTTALRRFYPEIAAGGFSDVDGTIRFYTRIRALLQEVGNPATVLDIGCGRGAYIEDGVAYRRTLRTLRDVARVVGIDVDHAGETNPGIDEFQLIETEKWPVGSQRFDLCVADWVIEHVPNPPAFFAECFRALKPGGHLCLRTLNRHSYVGFASRAIPPRIRGRALGHAQPAREEEDIFPTLYRCNTTRKIRQTLVDCGFAVAVYPIEVEPAYLSFSGWAYFLGVVYQRYAPPGLRTTILAFAKKP